MQIYFIYIYTYVLLNTGKETSSCKYPLTGLQISIDLISGEYYYTFCDIGKVILVSQCMW